MPVDEIIRALDTILEAHVAVANRGFVAVDFYDGAIIYDLEHAFVFLSEGQRGENDMHLWRGNRTLYDVVRAATELDPDKRFASVTELLEAWRSA